MSKASWYLARLRQMEPAEVVWRTRQAAALPFDFLRRNSRAEAPTVERWWVPENYPITFHQNGGDYLQTRIFDLQFPADFRFDWHCDYRNEKIVPRKFARSLDIRDPRVVGDIKYVWEINRHQHLSALAYSSHPQAQGIIATALGDWLDSNPYLEGVNWTSSLELGLRLISWAAIFPALQHVFENDEAMRSKFATSVFHHMKAIRAHLSRFSSANNHLIGELAGLYVGATCFAWWKECESWRNFARLELEREIEAQFSAEGVNREQAMSYQLFTLELLFMAALVGRNAGDEFSAAYFDRLRKGLDFLLLVTTPSGDLPMYGDSDDARGFLFSHRDGGLQAVMSLGAVVFDDPRYAALAGPPAAAYALTGRVPAQGEPAKVVDRAEILRDGGLAVVQQDDWKLVMDVGPLGFTEIAAHGHADALSVLIAYRDEYVLLDPGTFAYHSSPEWRSYFRGTAAHNTACVDGENQSVIRGRFLWGEKAKVKVTEFLDDGACVAITAEHDGYRRLADPVLHRRRVIFDKRQFRVLVQDTFECGGEHDVELHWNFLERADVKKIEKNAVRCRMGEAALHFSVENDCDVTVVQGSESPILGWRSPAFNVKVPAPTLRCAHRIHGSQTIETSINLVTAALAKGGA